MNNHLLMFVFVCGLLSLHCGVTQVTGGSTDTELGSVVTGMVYDKHGKPASQTHIHLIPHLYNPVADVPLPDSLTDTTDSKGEYVFSKIPEGTYTLLADHTISNEKLLITGIVIGDQDTQIVYNDTLQQTGSLAIEFLNPIDSINGYVYIPGTTFFVPAAKQAVLKGVPSVCIPAICYAHRTDLTKFFVIDTNVNVIAESTIVINDHYTWSFSKQIFLNTTASGADVKSDMTGFPVLIRLREGNFDFAQAKADGGDLRFSKSNGTPLPYEIERWDPVTRQAEVWVKVDTIYGNDSTHFIKMFWGDSIVTSESNGAVIFDTATGFQGVWHLEEYGDTINDATSNTFNGINSGATPIEGLIGNAKYFSNGSNIQIPGLLNSPSSITLSAWVNAGPTDPAQNGNLSQEIFSIGDAVLIRLDNASGIGTCGSYHNSGNTVGKDNGFAITGSGRYLANTGWHYISFTINSVTHDQRLYIDGEQCAIAHDVNPIVYDSLGNNTFIGIHGNGLKTSNFNGLVDEVRVNKTSLPSDWIKLCYMNQKEQDALVKW